MLGDTPTRIGLRVALSRELLGVVADSIWMSLDRVWVRRRACREALSKLDNHDDKELANLEFDEMVKVLQAGGIARLSFISIKHLISPGFAGDYLDRGSSR